MALMIEKFSFGVGDRFAHQAEAQLRACMLAAEQGADVVPVWNKSHREHTTVGSQPDSVRQAADAAVRELGWKKPYHVDADHIRLETVDGFIASSDFYTIDVADSIGQPAEAADVRAFVDRHADLVGRLDDSRHRPAAGRSRGPTSSASPPSICGPCKTPAPFTGTSPRPRAPASSSPKSRWMRPTARKLRPSCW